MSTARGPSAATTIPMPGAKPFSYVRACDLPERASEHRMLVEDLWADSGVGIIGGVPKQGKTWVALDLAVSVASGTPCLGRFAVPRPGPVLIYTAEDPDFAVRERLAGLCAGRGIAMSDLDVQVIREPALHLDRPVERVRLRQTVLEVRPRVVILDPLVRVYGNVDENSAAEVSSFLAYLRALQREMDVAVVVVHHAKKTPATNQAAGQSLRGSGDLYAWVDSLLFLRRSKGQLELVVEHRSVPGRDPIPLALVKQPPRPPHLQVVERVPDDGHGSHAQAVLSFLTRSRRPRTTDDVRKALGLRKERVVGLLRWLEESGRIQRDGRGWSPTEGFGPDDEGIGPVGDRATVLAVPEEE